MESKKVLLLILIMLLLVVAPGCWNRRDPEQLGIVLATAFDYDKERGLYQVIAQVANPVMMGGEAAGNQGKGGGDNLAFWTVSGFGKTPFEALEGLTRGTSRELFWAHSRTLLISEKLARDQGIGVVLDLVERQRQFRPIMLPAIVKGNLQHLMETPYPLEETGARGILRLIETTQFDSSIFPMKLLNEIHSTLEQPGVEMFIGRIEVKEEGTAAQGEGGKNDGGAPAGQPSPAQLGGAAMFRGDRMVGWADVHQVKGWSYATGRGTRYEFVIECPEHRGSFLSVKNFDVQSEMRPVVDGDDLRIMIRVRANGRLQDFGFTREHDLSVESEYLRKVERACAQAVRNRIEALISRCQELNADVLGLGNLVYRKQPRLWREIENRWDEILPELVVDLQVEYNLVRPGLVTNPVGDMR